MPGIFTTFKDRFQQHIIKPVIESHSPVKEAALGSAVGMFMGMTPTVGIQMWMVFMAWVISKYIFRTKFDLMIGTAMVWLSNPITMGPLYYGFLVTGAWVFQLVGTGDVMMSYSSFATTLDGITSNTELSSLEKFTEGVHFLIFDLGYPMIIGSLFWATPLALLSYIITLKYLKQYRIRKATNLGLSYEEWQKKYERST